MGRWSLCRMDDGPSSKINHHYMIEAHQEGLLCTWIARIPTTSPSCGCRTSCGGGGGGGSSSSSPYRGGQVQQCQHQHHRKGNVEAGRLVLPATSRPPTTLGGGVDCPGRGVCHDDDDDDDDDED
eukprot:scaffold1221_cov207-Amphora_coffeaeformis.AAC.61